MPKETHTKAAEHHENAAKAHRAAAEHHGKGEHDKGHEESTKAHEHSTAAHRHSTDAHGRVANTGPRNNLWACRGSDAPTVRRLVFSVNRPPLLAGPQQEKPQPITQWFEPTEPRLSD
jgi:hypothetical protein